MKKILFARILEEIPSFAVSPALGVLCLISTVRKFFPEYENVLFDTAMPYQKIHTLIDFVKKEDPDYIFFSITYTERDMLFDICEKLKKIFPEKIIVAGGIGVTCSPDEYLVNENIDFIVCSDGEDRTIDLLKNLEAGTWDFMDGIGYRKKGKSYFIPVNSYPEDLDKYGIPAWELVDFNTYSKLLTRNTILKNYPYATIITSRGCPFACPYCHRSFGEKIRLRSVENVLEELRLLKKLGIKEIHFLDDTFNMPLDRAKKLMRAIIKERFGFSIAYQGIRMDTMDDELLYLIKKAGGYNLEFGVQHVAPRIEKLLNRRMNYEKLLENVKKAENMGYLTQSHFIYGFPGEILEESRQNLEFAMKINSSFAAFFKLTPYPGTYFGNKYIKDYSSVKSEEFQFYSDDSRLNLGKTNASKLNEFQNYSHRKYYLRQGRIFKLFMKIPKNQYFYNQIIGEFFKRFIPDIYKIVEKIISFFKHNK